VSIAEDVPVRITGAWLNGLSPEERIAVMRGPFGRRRNARGGGFGVKTGSYRLACDTELPR